MSKFVSMEIQIKNLNDLKKCLKPLGLSLSSCKTIKGYNGIRNVDLSIVGFKTSKNYGIGLEKNTDGTYNLVCDRWDREIAGISDQISMSYKETQTMKILKHKAFFVKKREQISEKEIKLYVTL